MSNRRSSKKTKASKKVGATYAKDLGPTQDTPVRGDGGTGKRKANDNGDGQGPYAKKRAEDKAKASEEHDAFVKTMAGLARESRPPQAQQPKIKIPEIWKDACGLGQKEDAYEELQQAGQAHLNRLRAMFAQAEVDAVKINAKLKEAEREKDGNEQ